MDTWSQVKRVLLRKGRPSQFPLFGRLGEGVVVQSPGLRAGEQAYLAGGSGEFMGTDGLAVVAQATSAGVYVGLRELHVHAEISGLTVTLNLETWDPISGQSNDPASFDGVVVGWDFLNDPTSSEPFDVTFTHTYSAAGTYRIHLQTVYLPLPDVICNPDHPIWELDVTVS